MKAPRAMALVAAAVVTLPLAAADLDPVVLEVAVGSPRWVQAGPPPSGHVWTSTGAQVSKFGHASLSTGESVQVLIPAATTLEIHAERPIGADEVALYSGDGNGLARRLDLDHVLDAERTQAVLVPSTRARLLRIEGTSRMQAELGLRIEQRRVLPTTFARGFQTLDLPDEIALEDWGSFTEWQRGRAAWLEAWSPLVLELEGPLHLRLGARLPYSATITDHRQSADLVTTIDDENPVVHPLDFVAGGQPVKVSGKPVALSQPAYAFVDLSRGRHRLELQAARQLMISVEQAALMDPLLRLNRVEPEAADAWRRQQAAPGPGIELRDFLQQLRADARRPGSSGRAFASSERLEALALSAPELPQIASYSRRVAGRTLFFRDLEPIAACSDLERRAYHRRRLDALPASAPTRDQKLISLAAPLAGGLSGSLPSATFTPLAAGETLDFALPPQPATVVRLAVAGRPGQSETLVLTSDCGDPEELLLHPLLVAPEEVSGTPIASIAHALESDRFGVTGAPFRFSPPLPVGRAASLEIELAQGCRRLSLTRAGSGAPLAVAVAARAERERALSEQELLVLVAASKRGDAVGAKAQRDLEDLEHGWQEQRREVLEEELNLVGEGTLPWRLDDRDDEPMMQQSADPLIELERLTEALRRHGGGWPQVERVVQSLDRLGEWVLAEGLLRTVAIKGATRSLRHQAASAWLERRRESKLDGLSAALVLDQARQGDSPGQSAVASELLADGSFDDALWQILEAPPAQPHVMRWLADGLGWWELTPEIEDLAEARAAAWIDSGTSEVASPDGAELEEALAIHSRLRDPSLEMRARAILEWELRAGDSADSRWRPLDRRALTAHAGGVLFRSRATGMVGRRWLATSERPLVLQVAPGSVRLELRAFGEQLRSDSQWLLASTCGLTRPLLVRGGPISDSLEVLGRPEKHLGISRQATLEIPPGCWELQLQPETCAIAVAAERLESSRFSVLPTFEPEHATRVLLQPSTAPAGLPGRQVVVTPPAPLIRSDDPDGDDQAPNPGVRGHTRTDQPTFVRPVVQDASSGRPDILALQTATAARVGLRLGLDEAAGWSDAIANGNGPESVVATARWQGHDAACEHESRDPGAAAVIAQACLVAERVNRSLATLAAAISRTGGEQRRDLVYRRLELVLFAADRGLIPKKTALVEAAEVVHDNPGDQSVAELAEHLLAASAWRRLTPTLSAGLQLVEVPGWQRSTASMRARLALLDRPPTGERLLSGSETITLEIGNLTPSTSRLELEVHAPWVLRTQAWTAVWRLQDLDRDHEILEEARVVLSPGRKESILIDVPAGRWLLHVGLAEAQPNHVVSVHLREVGESAPGRQELLEAALARRLRFDVATPEQRIEVDLDGPAWVREDHLTDLGLQRRFHRIEAGPQTFRIETEGEELVRLWLLESAEAEPPPVKHQPPQLVADSAATRWIEKDQSRPNREQPAALIEGSADATREVSVFWRHVRSFDEDDVDDEAEEHLESRFERRKFITPAHHRESVALARVHDGTDLVLGVSEVHRLMLSGWRLRLGALAFAQTPVGRDVAVSSPWWSVHGRAELGRRFYLDPRSFHRPSLAVGARYLSLDEDDARAIGSIDNDIWTPYKADHQFAIRLAERLELRACDDLRLWARVSATSNENPIDDGVDNVRFAVGAHQMIGDLETRVFVGLSTYFADRDRTTQVSRPLLGVDLELDRWVLNGHRFKVGLAWRREIDSGRDSIAAGLSWVFEKGLGWRNEAPGSEPFKSRKRRRSVERSAVGGSP